MKKQTCTLFLIILTNLLIGQNDLRHIDITLNVLDSKVTEVTTDNATHSLRIVNYLFNSKEFQDSISKRDFNYHNVCIGCNSNKEDNRPRILGEEVLNKLFNYNTVPLNLILLKVGRKPILGRCFGLGFTCPNTNTITSYYKNINCDMSKELPFEYAYAVHLCHEYMHNIGYCHTDHVDDIAEATGWIAFHFINKWFKEGIRIP